MNRDLRAELIPAASAHHTLAMNLALGARSPSSARLATHVVELVAQARRKTLSLDLLVGAFRADMLLSAVLAVESPGHTALIFAPSAHLVGRDAIPDAATRCALEALIDLGAGRGLSLLQALVPEDEPATALLFKQAGFRYLTRLLYLRRPGSRPNAVTPAVPDLEWVTYGPDRQDLFLSTLEATYVDSLDCPDLVGLRRSEHVLAGHRATGEHDPNMWWVAKGEGRPAAILLLTGLPARQALEVVYVGVCHHARGQGVGNALVRRALEACRERSARYLTLAVDVANTPARRLYDRWGFEQTNARDAWIASFSCDGV